MAEHETRGLQLNEVLNMAELKKLFYHFSVTTGLDVALYDAVGREMVSHRLNAEESICAMAGKQCGKCIENVRYGGEKSCELGEPYIFRCGCGLIMCSSPVMAENELMGSIACGPVMLWDADEYAESELRGSTEGLGLTDSQIHTVVECSKQLSCVNMTSASQILFILVNYMCREGTRYLQQRKEIGRQQSKIAELLAEKKRTAASLDVMERSAKVGKYPADQEKELIAFVQLGDKRNAKRMLNEFLSEIFSFANGNLDMIRAKLYELTAFLSRAAVEAGAPLEALTDTVKKSALLLRDDSDFESLCFLTGEILESFMDTVYEYRSKKLTSQHLAKAILYIKQNYRDELSLDGVSKKVFVSGYYLSHLFREEMNITFSDYVCKIRIEEAKKLLKERSLKIQEVAEYVGFNDANYFAKSFKKLCGVSPKQYQSFFSGAAE